MYWGYEGVKEPRATPPACYERRHKTRLNLKSTIYRVIRACRNTKVDFSLSICAFNPNKQSKWLKNTLHFTTKKGFMTRFYDLGEDLADIVCDFAFKCRYSEVFYSLRWYLKILCFRFPEHLMNRRLYSPKYRRVLPNPLIVFEPIQNFGSYRDLFDWSTVYMLLWQLDFRRKIVRVYGSRGSWHTRFALDWKNVLEFVIYYRTLVCLPDCIKVFRPTLMPLINSPFNTPWGHLPY